MNLEIANPSIVAAEGHGWKLFLLLEGDPDPAQALSRLTGFPKVETHPLLTGEYLYLCEAISLLMGWFGPRLKACSDLEL